MRTWSSINTEIFKKHLQKKKLPCHFLIEIRASLLQTRYISKLVKIAAITSAVSRVKAKATYVSLVCKNCQGTREVPCRPGLAGTIVPRSWDHIPQPGEEPCPIDPWIVVPDKGKCVDLQTLKLQENTEIEELKMFASQADVFEAICSKIAPSILGEENVKKAVACLLFGRSRKMG